MIVDFTSKKPGEKIAGFFTIRKIEYKTSKDNREYIVSELGNKYGRLKGYIWEGVEDFRKECNERDIIKVKGRLSFFGGTKQLNIEKFRKLNDDDNIGKEDLIPHAECDLDELKKKLFNLIETIKNPFLSELLNKYFSDENFLSQYFSAPAGKLWHHNYIGGLAVHSISVAEICEKVSEIHPSVDRDLLITGAVLHDIGKIKELDAEGFIDYTDEGRLIGHVVMQAVDVIEKINSIPEFPKETKNRVIHMLVSHQGEKEKGAPVVPQTLEGIILHYADELDSQASAFERIEKKEYEPGKKWSNFVNLIERYIFFGEKDIEDDNQG